MSEDDTTPDEDQTDEVEEDRSPELLAKLAVPVDEMPITFTTLEMLASLPTTPERFQGKPRDMLAVVLVGRELGVKPMSAINNLYLVDGDVAMKGKLMSALVFLETNPDLDDTVTITMADAKCSGKSQLRVRETFTLRDLMHASLMSSSNRATRALARATDLSPLEFVSRMNRKAKELSLENTLFCEPTGLDENNISTALDCAKLLYFALQNSVIASILSKTTYEFVSLSAGKRRHRIGSTNKLLFSSLNVKGGKTGYNGASGWCLGTMVEGEDGKEMVAVILDAPTKHTRFKEIRSIVEWCIEESRKGS